MVLSGFLITTTTTTTLHLEEWVTTGRVNLAAFWGRRARRLPPPLFLVCNALFGPRRQRPDRPLRPAGRLPMTGPILRKLGVPTREAAIRLLDGPSGPDERLRSGTAGSR